MMASIAYFDDQPITLEQFLTDYWQKKPLLIRNALPHFTNPLSADELAGLALEEAIESRLICETPKDTPQWHLKRGPFTEAEFHQLPPTHWTLLVQGVDRLIPEVYSLLDAFDFIPQWRIDDVMISYATKGGSVGPHYDHYDVFLFQAKGRREWSLTTQHCTPDNYLPNLELRIMREFITEQHFILEEGDMLYLPPHVGHHGVSLSDECMTYSFGYRSYNGQELLDSLGEYVAEQGLFKQLYQDPNWLTLKNSSELEAPAWKQAQHLLHELINDELLMKSWFGCFATQLDQHAEQHLPNPLEDEVILDDFIAEINQANTLHRDPCCRFASIDNTLFINGCSWPTESVSKELIVLLANNRAIPITELRPWLDNNTNLLFLFELWKLQWLDTECG
jgi:50S ribosomal protein L16 3-hydroxylase